MYNKIIKTSAIKLSSEQIGKELINLNSWIINDGKLIKSFQFKSFDSTWAFLQRTALTSHLLGHHPHISTIYNKVEIQLSTHDVDGLSDVDFKLAKKIDKFY